MSLDIITLAPITYHQNRSLPFGIHFLQCIHWILINPFSQKSGEQIIPPPSPRSKVRLTDQNLDQKLDQQFNKYKFRSIDYKSDQQIEG